MQETLFLVSFCMAFAVCFSNFKNPTHVIDTYGSISYKMLFHAFLLLFIVFSICYLISQTNSFLSYGWMHLFNDRGGSLIGQQVALQKGTSGNPAEILQCYIFFFLFLYAMPYIIEVEERIFRYGKTKLKTILLNSIGFGFLHILVGLPISVGIALTLMGFFLGMEYKRKYEHFIKEGCKPEEAFLKSEKHTTSLHVAYNSLIILIGLSLMTYLLQIQY